MLARSLARCHCHCHPSSPLPGRTFYATPLRAKEDAASAAGAAETAAKPPVAGAKGSAARAAARPPLGPPLGPGCAGLSLVARLAGARVVSRPCEVDPHETLVLGTPGEQRWSREHLAKGTKVYDKEGFVAMLLMQSCDAAKPAFTVG
jgi:hypothetical protein